MAKMIHHETGERAYRYPHFERKLLMEDTSFKTGPSPGEPMLDFELPTTRGGLVRKRDFVGERPVLLAFGSITCPMTAAARPVLGKLHREFGDRVEFVTVYVREAHPGDRYPQVDSIAEKIRRAREYGERDDIPWTIAVDDAEGSLHRALDPKPTAAYLVNADGTVAHRTLWSNDERPLRKALRAVTEGRAAMPGETNSHLVPMLSGMGAMYEVVQASGPTARRDVLRQAPPMWGLARLASLYRPLPPLGRGIAAMATAGAGLLALTWGIRRLART